MPTVMISKYYNLFLPKEENSLRITKLEREKKFFFLPFDTTVGETENINLLND